MSGELINSNNTPLAGLKVNGVSGGGGGGTGPQGPPGPPGPTGPQGPVGPQGPTGATGPAGANGAQGIQGPIGPQGNDGPAGPQGVAGTPGATGPTGPTGPQGPPGNNGATGATGAVGPVGPAGPTGPAGAGFTYSILLADFNNSTITANNVGLSVALAINSVYEIQGSFIIQTSLNTVGAQLGIDFPTGVTGAARIDAPSTLTANISANSNGTSDFSSTISGHANSNIDFYAWMRGTIIVGATPPSGDLQITLKSEVGGTNVVLKAGSNVSFRKIS